MRNNVEEIKGELRSRQLDYDKKLSDDEEEEDTTSEQRHLRKNINKLTGSTLNNIFPKVRVQCLSMGNYAIT
jgi:hypothetical protein